MPLSGDRVMYIGENGEAYLKSVKESLEKSK